MSVLLIFGAAVVSTFLLVRRAPVHTFAVVGALLGAGALLAGLSGAHAAAVVSIGLLTSGVALGCLVHSGEMTRLGIPVGRLIVPVLSWSLVLVLLQGEQGALSGVEPGYALLRLGAQVVLGAGLWWLLHVRAELAGGALLLGGLLTLRAGGWALPVLQLPVLAWDGGVLQVVMEGSGGNLLSAPVVVGLAWVAPVLAVIGVLTLFCLVAAWQRKSGGVLQANAGSGRLAAICAAAVLAYGLVLILLTLLGKGGLSQEMLDATAEASRLASAVHGVALLHPGEGGGALSAAVALVHVWPLLLGALLLLGRVGGERAGEPGLVFPGVVLLWVAGLVLLAAEVSGGGGFPVGAGWFAMVTAGVSFWGALLAFGPERGTAVVALAAGGGAPLLLHWFILG